MIWIELCSERPFLGREAKILIILGFLETEDAVSEKRGKGFLRGFSLIHLSGFSFTHLLAKLPLGHMVLF